MHGSDPFYQCILINTATVTLIALAFGDIWYEGVSKYLQSLGLSPRTLTE